MVKVFGPEDADVLILCGGLGKRLRSSVSDRPKVLAKINGRPFIDFLIDYVAGFGFRRFILCTGYKKEMIKEHFRKNRPGKLKILFSEEKRPLGTAGAIKNAEAIIKSNPFLAMNGDTFSSLNYNKFLNFHIGKKAWVSLALAKAKADCDTGFVHINSAKQITRYNEKQYSEGKNYYFNLGIYLMERKLLSRIPKGENFSLEYELFPAVGAKKFYGFISNAEFIDIGTPRNYKKAAKFLLALHKHKEILSK